MYISQGGRTETEQIPIQIDTRLCGQVLGQGRKYQHNPIIQIMKLKANSWHAKLYEFAYGEKPQWGTRNGCFYFWKVAFAGLTLPLYFIGGLIQHFWYKDDPWTCNDRGYVNALALQLVTIMFTAMFFITGAAICHAVGYDIVDVTFGPGLLFFTIGFVTAALVGLTLFGIGVLICYLHDNDNKLKEIYRAWKDKHCPIIEWEEPPKDEKNNIEL